MKKFLSLVAVAVAIAGCHGRSEPVRTAYMVVGTPTVEDGVCYMRTRLLTDPKAPPELQRYVKPHPSASKTNGFRRLFDTCRMSKEGDRVWKTDYVRKK